MKLFSASTSRSNNFRLAVAVIFSLVTNLLPQHTWAQNKESNIQENEAGIPYNIDLLQQAKRHSISESLDLLKLYLKPDNKVSFRIQSTVEDKYGYRHDNYAQLFDDVPVEFGSYTVVSKAGTVVRLTGNYIPVKSGLSSKATLTEQVGIQKAIDAVKAKKYRWQDTSEEFRVKQLTNDNKATYYPKGRLVVAEDENRQTRLAYTFYVSAVEPEVSEKVYVDAQTGDVFKKESLVINSSQPSRKKLVDSPGAGDTRYSGRQNFTTDLDNGSFRLRQSGRGNGIQTLNSNTGGNDFTDNNNDWTAIEYNNAARDNVALDIHWGAERTYDYFNQVHGWSGWNGTGGLLVSNVHAVINGQLDNAAWNSATHQSSYGDGQTLFNPLGSLDVVGHEFGHGYTQGMLTNPISNPNGDLGTHAERGSINEGLSDIWASCIEAYYPGLNKNAWLIGEEVVTGGLLCLRSLRNPFQEGDTRSNGFQGYPDTYLGANWSGGNTPPHQNSTVLSHWFYILSDGKIGSNDTGYPFYITGISRANAASVVFRAVRFGLNANNNVNFNTMRTHTITAVNDVFGPCSQERRTIEDAWAAVGVGNPYPTLDGEYYRANQRNRSNPAKIVNTVNFISRPSVPNTTLNFNVDVHVPSAQWTLTSGNPQSWSTTNGGRQLQLAFNNGPNGQTSQSATFQVTTTSNGCAYGFTSRSMTFAMGDYYGYSVYPNPASETVYLEFEKVETPYLLPDRIELFSERSEKIKSLSPKESNSLDKLRADRKMEINVRGLSKGVYHLIVTYDGKEGAKPQTNHHQIIVE